MSEFITQSDQRPDVDPPVVCHGEADQFLKPVPPSLAAEPSIVRAAQPQDEAGIMALCRLMHAENGLFSLNEDKVLRTIRRAWANDRVLIGVIGTIGSPVACAALMLTDSWYSDDPVIGDFMVFVHPDHRKSRHARNLLEYTKRVSDSLDVTVTIGVFGIGNADAKSWENRFRFYRRIFGEPEGFFFAYNRKTPAAVKVEEAA